jgi:hypothetical protein
MQKLITLLIAASALALTLVAIAPDQASANWRRGWGHYGRGVGVYVRPSWGYRRHSLTPIIPIGAARIGIAYRDRTRLRLRKPECNWQAFFVAISIHSDYSHYGTHVAMPVRRRRSSL